MRHRVAEARTSAIGILTPKEHRSSVHAIDARCAPSRVHPLREHHGQSCCSSAAATHGSSLSIRPVHGGAFSASIAADGSTVAYCARDFRSNTPKGNAVVEIGLQIGNDNGNAIATIGNREN